MAEDGEERLVAVARRIAKTLGDTDDMTDDILRVFSNFDGRLREKLREKLSGVDVEQTLNSIDRQICRHISSDHSIWSNSADASSFLDSIDRLITAIRDWTPLADDKSVSYCLDHAEYLLQKSMFRLKDEFRTLIDHGAESFGLTRGESANHNDSADADGFALENIESYIPVAHPITDYDIIIDALPASTIGDLHEIAKRMVLTGYANECCHAYSTYRREFMEESLSRLGLQKLGINEAKKIPWPQLEDEIERWIKAANVSLRILFPSERRLCDRIFFGFSFASNLSFMEVCRDSTNQLLNFADAVVIRGRAPERLFKVLDVYETVRDLMPEFDLIFSDQHSLSLRNEAITIWRRLGEVIRGIFMELENLIRQDPAKVAIPGGGVHPITRYVMNYLRAACKSLQTLAQVYQDNTGGNIDCRRSDASFASRSSSLKVQMTWIMELLESNLEAKSELYRDTALCSVFMMNNGRYMVQKVKDNDLGTLLGNDWIRKHEGKVRQYLVNYQRSSWTKIFGVLRLNSNSISPTGPSKNLRENLRQFNSYLEEICRTQSSWVIFDDQLREEMRASICAALCPAYRNFIGRLQAVLDFGQHIRYTVEDIEAHVNQLFLQGRGN